MAHPTDNHRVRQAVTDTVHGHHAHGLVAAYFDPSHGFAGALFDGLDPSNLLTKNPRDDFTADDIAAVSLLNVRFGPVAVRSLLTSASIRKALTSVPHDVPLWEATPADLTAVAELWRLVRSIDGVGRTRASKLLARKRPHLVPIVDSVIAAALCLGDDTWRPLATTLQDPQLRHDIDALRPPQVNPQMSTLRLLDVLTWMSHSRSTAAVTVQGGLGAPTTRNIPTGRIT